MCWIGLTYITAGPPLFYIYFTMTILFLPIKSKRPFRRIDTYFCAFYHRFLLSCLHKKELNSISFRDNLAFMLDRYLKSTTPLDSLSLYFMTFWSHFLPAIKWKHWEGVHTWFFVYSDIDLIWWYIFSSHLQYNCCKLFYEKIQNLHIKMPRFL